MAEPQQTIKLSEEIVPDITTRLGNVMGELSLCTEKLETLCSELQSLNTYQGKAQEEALIFYVTMKNHVSTLTLLYGMALQQAYASFANIWAADIAGAGMEG